MTNVVHRMYTLSVCLDFSATNNVGCAVCVC